MNASNTLHALAAPLMAACAFVVLALGVMHLMLTFRSDKLRPRDAALYARLQEAAPVISRRMTMWKAWVGFNASHSFGLLLFGLVYGYLGLVQGPLLFGSPFLLVVGLLVLGGYAFLSKRYWFKGPFRYTVLATALYVSSLVAHWA